jgi:hypothetical protein
VRDGLGWRVFILMVIMGGANSEQAVLACETLDIDVLDSLLRLFSTSVLVGVLVDVFVQQRSCGGGGGGLRLLIVIDVCCCCWWWYGGGGDGGWRRFLEVISRSLFRLSNRLSYILSFVSRPFTRFVVIS